MREGDVRDQAKHIGGSNVSAQQTSLLLLHKCTRDIHMARELTCAVRLKYCYT